VTATKFAFLIFFPPCVSERGIQARWDENRQNEKRPSEPRQMLVRDGSSDAIVGVLREICLPQLPQLPRIR
jgi:hypothetical protein